MHLNAAKLLQPVFDFLDGLIRDHGETMFMVFAYAAIPFLIWVLCGGLRRKLYQGKQVPPVSSVIVVHIPIGRPRVTFDDQELIVLILHAGWVNP